MKPSRTERASYALALLTSFFVSIATALQPSITQAADGDTNATLAMPPADTGLREPSSGGSLVLRGTRPVSPAPTQARNASNQTTPPPYEGWRPVQQIGPGWSTDYDWSGLSNVPTPGR